MDGPPSKRPHRCGSSSAVQWPDGSYSPFDNVAEGSIDTLFRTKSRAEGLRLIWAQKQKGVRVMPELRRWLNSIAASLRSWGHWLALGGCLVPLMLGIVSIPTAASGVAPPPGWSIAASPNSGTGLNQLDGVSCHRASSCQAVGFYLDTSLGHNQTLIESWNGTSWSIVPSPSNGTGDNDLLGVSCAAASSCQAVGFSDFAGVHRTLIESWNGTSWSIAPSPNNGTSYNILDGVSCRAKGRSCQAVGYYYDTSLGATQTLIESWNGTTWSIVPSPSNGPAQNILYGVSCHRASSCQAVGYYQNSVTTQTLIESWNGTTWSIVPSPNNGTAGNFLLSVSCRSANSCQAVGQYADASVGQYQTLVESWDGTTWSIAPSPNNGTAGNDLLGVSCQSANSCQAVGLYFVTSLGHYRTLVESWDGTTWSIVPSPNNGTGYNVLAAVSCRRAARSCQAVGNYLNTSLGTYQTLTESSG